MNKAELIETLSKRLGDRKTATAALESVVEEIQRAVSKGERVAITGFGVFEKRIRNARTARNPRTGEAVKVKKTSVPAFRPGRASRTSSPAPRRWRRPPSQPRAAATKTTRGQASTAKARSRAKAPAKKAPAKAAGQEGGSPRPQPRRRRPRRPCREGAAPAKTAPTKATKATGQEGAGQEGRRRRHRPRRRRPRRPPRRRLAAIARSRGGLVRVRRGSASVTQGGLRIERRLRHPPALRPQVRQVVRGQQRVPWNDSAHALPLRLDDPRRAPARSSPPVAPRRRGSCRPWLHTTTVSAVAARRVPQPLRRPLRIGGVLLLAEDRLHLDRPAPATPRAAPWSARTAPARPRRSAPGRTTAAPAAIRTASAWPVLSSGRVPSAPVHALRLPALAWRISSTVPVTGCSAVNASISGRSWS